MIAFLLQQNQSKVTPVHFVKIFSISNCVPSFCADWVWILNIGYAQTGNFFKLQHFCSYEDTWLEMFCLHMLSIYK